jgi:uncharacterized protein YfbU (UPF0304 family)
MAGLLGSMIAGAAGGYAKQRIDTLNKEEDFDFRQALQASEAEYNMQLKRAGIELENENEQAKFDKRVAGVKAADASVADPMEGKGGYEAPEDEEKRKLSTLEKRAAARADAGYTTEADVLYKRIDASNKNANQLSQIEARRMQIEGTLTNAQEKLRLQGEANTAKAEAAAAKASGGRAPTEAEIKRGIFLKAYKNNPEYVKNGEITEKGYDKFYKLEENQAFDEVTEKDVMDTMGRPVKDKNGKQVVEKTVKKKVPAGGKKDDPLGLFP